MPALDHRNSHAIHPDIFAQQGRGARDGVERIFGNPVALKVMQRMNDLPADFSRDLLANVYETYTCF